MVVNEATSADLEGSGKGPPGILDLRDVWEIYIKLVKLQDRSADTIKRQDVALDVLLHLCAWEMEGENPLPGFSDMKSVCNQLCKEFMSDIVKITSSVTDEEDVTQLKNYLLEGRGWILLQVIHRSGVQSVSGGRDLANLLVSLLPWCLKFPMQPPGIYTPDGLPPTQFRPVIQCFQEVLKSVRGKLTRQKSRAVPLSRQGHRADVRSEKWRDQGSSKRKFTHKRNSNRSTYSGEDGDSSEVNGKSKGKGCRKPRLTRIYHPAEIHSQQVPDSDSDEDDIHVLLGKFRREPKRTGALELCMLVLDLLLDLCNSDHGQSSPFKYLSSSILPHLLQALLITENIVTPRDRDTGDRGSSDGSQDPKLVCRVIIQKRLLRVIFTASGIVAAQQNGVNMLIGHKIVSHILSIGQRSSIFQLGENDDGLFCRENMLEMGLISDILTGLLLCFDVVFHHLPFNPTFIKSAVNLIEEFDNMQGFQMLKKTILFVDWLKSVSHDQVPVSDWLEEDPVKVLGSFLNTMKIVRVNYIHSMKCVKRKHQKCEYTHYFDHHHDILGLAAGTDRTQQDDSTLLLTRQERAGSQSSSASQPPVRTVCLVYSCTDFLLGVLTKVVSKGTRLEVLRTIYTSGICCCMKLENIVGAFLVNLDKFSPAVRSFALDALNKVVLEHFSGGMPVDRSEKFLFSCTHCDIDASKKKKKDPALCGLGSEHSAFSTSDPKTLDSGFSSSDLHGESTSWPLNKLTKWRALHQLKSVLYSNNESVAISMARHLLVLAVKGNPFLKAELFFSIYYDTLGTAEVSGQLSNKKTLSRSVQVHCLSALPYLLQANCVTKVFLTKKGILKMLEFLEDDILRSPVLRIFEALVVLDEQKLDEGSQDLSPKDVCPCPYGGGLVIGSFIEELTKRSFNSDTSALANIFDYEEEEEEEEEEQGIRIQRRVRKDSVVLIQWTLPVLVDLWETCAKLCVHSRAFVTIFRDLQCFRKTEGLLLETVQILTSTYPVDMGDSGTEDNGHTHNSSFFKRIALLESLVVVCAACDVMETEASRTIKTWQRMRHVVAESRGLEPSRLKFLFDAVLNAAMPQYMSILEYSYSNNTALVYMRDDDIYDEDEVRQILFTGSEDEAEQFTAELGYDADSEGTYLEEREQDRLLKCRHLLTKVPKKIYYPAVFRLLLDLLITVKATTEGTSVFYPVLHKLLQTVKGDARVISAMCEENLLEMILNKEGLWQQLVVKEGNNCVQEVLLALVQELAQSKLWSHDLRKLLQLFQQSDVPIEKLLIVLLNVVERSEVKPQYSVTFPVQAIEPGSLGPAGPLLRKVSSRNLLGDSVQEDVDGEPGKGPQCQQDVWETCAMQVSLRDSLIWPPFQNGFSLVMWIHMVKGQGHCMCPVTETRRILLDPDNELEICDTGSMDKGSSSKQNYNLSFCLHLVSMGTKEKLLEIWADPTNACLIFRLTSEISDVGLVVRETELKGIVSLDRWQQLVVSYVETLDGSTLTGKTTVVIDGSQTHEFILDHPYSAIRSRRKSGLPPPQLCIGHTLQDPHSAHRGKLSLGSLMLFKGDVISKEACFHLYTQGPNYTSISKSDCGEETFCYAPYLSKAVVTCARIHYDYLVGLRKPDLTQLRCSLLLSYNAKSPQELSVYGPLLKGSGSAQLPPSALGLSTDSFLLTQQPKQTIPTLQGVLVPGINTGLDRAVEECGGTAAILFLVAKVYESCHDNVSAREAEALQARALQVLLTMIGHSSYLMQDYINMSGHSLLTKVLTSSRSVIGNRILKVLMDASTSEPMFRYNTETDALVLRQRSEAVIRDATVIEQLILNWQIWEGSDSSLIVLLFSGLANLVRDDHPHQNFNVKQFQAINLVNKMFKIYQERIQEGVPALPVEVSQHAIAIVQSMMGSPPDYHLIMDMCDFLLMVHPATNTYINHSRSGFYFSISWGVPASPLTVIKQRMKWPPLGNSTPVKQPSQEEKVPEVRRNLSAELGEKESQPSRTYPLIELAKEMKPRSNSDPAPPTDRTGHQAQLKPVRSEGTLGVGSTEDISPTDLTGLSTEEEEGEDHEEEEEEDSGKTESADEVGNSPVESGYHVKEMKENLSLKFDEDDVELAKLEGGLVALCVGLLRLLSSIILTMPDAMTDRAFRKSIINPRILIVLAHNSSPEIREAVIKVLSAYLERSGPQHLEMFLKMDGFQLLSAQLLQYPSHQEQVEAAVSLVLHRPFRLDEGLQALDSSLCTGEELSQVQQSAMSLILALLGNTTSDLALCHNLLELCSHLFDTSTVLAGVMMDLGLVEVLCNMLVRLLEDGVGTIDIEGVDENEILFKDLLEFFKIIAVREFSASYPQHYQQFEDIITLLKEIERKKEETDGAQCKAVQTVRIFQHYVLLRVLKVIEDASEEVSQQSFTLFSKPARSPPPSYDPAGTQRPSPLAHKPHTASYPLLRNLTSPPQHFSLSGSFAKMTLPRHRKSAAGHFIHSADRPFQDGIGSAISGSGDSDSSIDSFYTSVQTVNLPVVSRGTSRTKSVEASQSKLVRSNSLLQSVLSIGKRKKLTTSPISQAELIERLKKVLSLAVDLASFTGVTEKKVSDKQKVTMVFDSATLERDFQRRLFNFTYKAFEATLPQEKSFYKRTRNVIMWGAKDVLRVQLGRLLCHMLCPEQEFDQKVYALSYMMGELRGSEVLKMILPASDVGNDLGYYVRELMVAGQKWLSSQQMEDGAKFLNLLSSMGYSVTSPRKKLSEEMQEQLQERKRIIETKHTSQKLAWLKKRETALRRIYQKFDSFATNLSGHAMEVTQAVTQLQTQERNKFILHVKQTMTDRIQVKKQWQEIVQNLTHERAMWYDEKSYPQSWQLNPTEGPCRVRKRFQRAHLGLPPKFLKEEFRYKLDSDSVDPPLIYLFEDDHMMSDSAALIYKLHKNKKIRYTSTCRAVSPNSESKGELLIGEDSVFFVADEAITDANYTQALLGNKDQLSMTWPFEDVREIHKRWYELMDRGLEIFLTSGKTCLLAFDSTQERDRLYQHLINLELPNRKDAENTLDVLSRWEDGEMTNFEYLTHLNKISGRSFNDLMQYPVMPFILKDYTSATLDLQDKAVYRDLSKPVSIQNSANEEKFMMNYAIIKQEYEKVGKEGITGLCVEPYHYGSHYSNSGTVLHYLVRLPPFTRMFLNFQDQSFDIPDRTFHNLHTSWRLSSAESNTDVKELIPEFFFCHEMFINREGFDFGKRQTNDEVWDVVLPPWCNGNPRLFILVHRQALESDYVTEWISSWVDLVFGYKQRGEAAVKAINVYHPATYFGLDISKVSDPLDRKAIRTMVRTYGQTPKQLFRAAHPRRIDPARPEVIRHKAFLRKLQTVTGWKWGTYLGSPALPEPDIVWQQTYAAQTSCLVPLRTGTVFGICAKTSLLTQYSQERNSVWAAMVTWGHPDGMIRINNNPNKPPVNFIKHSQYEDITCCVAAPDCRYLYVGGTSGTITIYNTKYNPAKESEFQVFGHKKRLYGHTKAINTLVVCRPYSVLVSASDDHTCIIWDLNRHSYVRSIESHQSAVKVLAVSGTLGDIASVSQQGLGSCLALHTVNAELVGTVDCEDTITCLSYSQAPEGISINVIAGGLTSGIVRLWNSWDLSPVRDLCNSEFLATPVVSLTFTHDSKRLYASHSDGRVVLWDYSKPRYHLFKPYLYPT